MRSAPAAAVGIAYKSYKGNERIFIAVPASLFAIPADYPIRDLVLDAPPAQP